ncbi:MAG: TonB family protein [Chitinivibrionales bacterium]|nr:TonB family protein [Chitinivibrionales bacterium]
MTAHQNEALLKAYEHYIPSASPLIERLFKIILLLVVALFIGLGMLLQKIKTEPEKIVERIERIKTRFIIEEEKTEPKKIEKPKPTAKKTEEKEPVDLTKKPELKQNVDDIVEEKPKKRKVRRVYGLKKVYSKGIGSGGKLSDAVIGKLGNTINKDLDTITATKEEVKGQIVSATTITSAPKFKKRVKPEYTKEMLENKIEGVIKVRILVDIDGKVKRATALNDLGYGSAQQAVKACRAMEFTPALVDGTPRATRIIIPIRFVLLG